MSSQEGLKALTFDQRVAVDNYRAAMTGALGAADSIADKVVTSSIALATAYGAVIALVAPKDAQAPWQAALPFVPLAIAVGLALNAQRIGVDIEPTNDVARVRDATKNAITGKRRWGAAALVSLAIGLFVAGWVVYKYYGPSARSEDTTPATAEVYLTPAGTSAIKRVCNKAGVTVLSGQVDGADALNSARVSVKVTKSECPAGAGTVVLPQKMIAASKLT